jgi:hypothetical protein
MKSWTFWEWLAYAGLLVAAVIIAADTGFRISPDLSTHLPHWIHSVAWGFAPLTLIGIATCILIARAFGWIGPFWKRPLTIFLERDSNSDLHGIQTFPNISYIQVSVLTSIPLLRCRAWVTKVEYSPDNLCPYALEHGERHPLSWSKHGGSDPFETELNPGEPPVRINVSVFNNSLIQFESTAQTPTNLIQPLQRIGFHRLTINIGALRNGSPISETRQVIIEWRGSAGAFVSLV